MPSEAKRGTTAAKSGPAQKAKAAKDAPAKTASAKDAPAKKVNPALMKPLQPSKSLPPWWAPSRYLGLRR